MTLAQQMVIDQLRNEGYFIVMWTPGELGADFDASDAKQLEDLLISNGNDFIEDCNKR